MRRTLLLYLILALLAIGAADHLNLATNDNHETNNHDSVKIERYLSERTSLEHLEETKYITDAMRKGYKTNDELYAALNALHATYPTLTRVFSIGKSVSEVDIMALEISAQAGIGEPHEPHVKLVANMHGNEPSGRELLLRFGEMLLTQHGTDPLITALLEHTHIFIVPTLNPDGFEAGWRNNKNRIDLNRNFPDQFLDPKEDLARRQPETRALMEFTRRYPFVMSVNMHEGDLVVNYPFDGNPEARNRYSKAPDDEMFKVISKEYAQHNPAIMGHRFKDGVTNGAAWYPLNGGMQDWNYIWAGCFEVTVEASMEQFPAATKLDQLWLENNRSLLAFTALSPSGMHGQIVDKDSNEGVQGVIRILAPNTGLYNIRAGSAGYFRRLIMPGEYTVEVSASGYHSLVTNFTVTAFDAANDFTNERNRLVFTLTPFYNEQAVMTSSYVVFFVGIMSMVSLFFVMGLPLKNRLTRTRSYARTPQIV